MTRRLEKSLPPIDVVLAGLEQEPILANLLELYAYDFSEFLEVEMGADGRFGYSDLALYWTEPDRHPLLVKADGRLAGLALVKRGPDISGNEDGWDMAEFFVLRGFRRRGIGTEAAHAVWRRFPGTWDVRVMESNASGYDFWAHAISAFVGESVHSMRVNVDGRSWERFRFESSRAG